MFDWDRNNLRKIRAHRIEREEVEQTLTNVPALIDIQDVEGEQRLVYYGESDAGRLLAIVVTERGPAIRVVTSYDLDTGQKRDYLKHQAKESEHDGEEAN